MRTSFAVCRALLRRRILVAAVLPAVLVAGALWLGRSHVEALSSSSIFTAVRAYAQPPMVTTTRLSVLFAGDEVAAGYGGIGLNAYPYLVCNAVGLNCHVDAQPGTGLVNDGRLHSGETDRLIDRLPSDAALYDVDVLIVDAGRNDSASTVFEFVSALEDYLVAAERIWPGLAVFVMLPTFPSADADTEYRMRAVAVTEVVELQGGIVIDPIALGWYAGVDLSSLSISGGSHLNQHGHVLIAGKLSDALARNGVGPDGTAA
ncbi:hypothetical protein BH11ACT7_BH11ACT7_02400 [soil metagenome]